MPRTKVTSPALRETAGVLAEALVRADRHPAPRLWNAKRKIKSGRVPYTGSVESALQDRDSQAWKELVSEDVVSFIEDAKLPSSERRKCLENPSEYFSYPNNVPNALRKQIYFPRFTIALKRSPHLPPKYASFDVPLWFNKLDMKDYLRSVYGVDVVHVRSAVFQAKVTRKDAKSKHSNGQLYRPPSWKKMTVELVHPFIWPEEIKDLEPWEKDTFYKGRQFALDANRKREETAALRPDRPHQKSIAQQAKELLSGKTAWKSTWESMPTDSRILKPFDQKKLGTVINSRTAGRSVSAPR